MRLVPCIQYGVFAVLCMDEIDARRLVALRRFLSDFAVKYARFLQ
jgi:hypothetical protein